MENYNEKYSQALATDLRLVIKEVSWAESAKWEGLMRSSRRWMATKKLAKKYSDLSRSRSCEPAKVVDLSNFLVNPFL